MLLGCAKPAKILSLTPEIYQLEIPQSSAFSFGPWGTLRLAVIASIFYLVSLVRVGY
jgi:hypothetical protein